MGRSFFKHHNDLLLPAIIGLGVFAQCNEINLANNTTTLLTLFLLLEDHSEIEELEEEVECMRYRECNGYTQYNNGYCETNCCTCGCRNGYCDRGVRGGALGGEATNASACRCRRNGNGNGNGF